MKRQQGMTLVELVLAIVIIGIAAAALYGAMAAISARSADPMLRQQSLAIAEAYLEEILLQPFTAPAAALPCPVGTPPRACFDDVQDYAGLTDNGAHDARGQAIGPLGNYEVSVTVTPQAWNGLASVDALYIEVTVLDPAGQSLVLGGYRARY